MITLCLFIIAVIGAIVSSIACMHTRAKVQKAHQIFCSEDASQEDIYDARKYIEEWQGLARAAPFICGGMAVYVIALGAICCIYTQDAGDVVVLRSISGTVDGMTKDAGLHWKMPWQETVTYDQRNNVISFVEDDGESYVGGSADGPSVTVNDSGGASANVDIQVNYSLDPNYAMDLYRDYGSQETFVRSVVAVDARSLPGTLSWQFDTLTMLNNHGEFAQAIEEALSAKWAGMGLIVEQVSIQNVHYNEDIEKRYNQAQEAEVAKQQALNEQETAKVQAETRRIEAEGQAEANRTLQESLSDEVLMQHYIDKLGESEFIVVPQGQNLMLNLDQLSQSTE